MTDSTLNVFVGYGTEAARAAFTPSPPTPASGFSPLYVYRATDTKHLWLYDTSWHDLGKFEGSFALVDDITPSQITSDQNDYNPTGLSTASTLRLSSDASRNITGLQGGADGRILFIHNVGSNNIVLKDESASSSAANRFALTADVTLSADAVAVLQYDSTSSRWRCVSGGGGGSGTVTSVATDGTYLTGGPITATGTVSPTNRTKAAVNVALHAHCGGI
jgi:hypothetical protein